MPVPDTDMYYTYIYIYCPPNPMPVTDTDEDAEPLLITFIKWLSRVALTVLMSVHCINIR